MFLMRFSKIANLIKRIKNKTDHIMYDLFKLDQYIAFHFSGPIL